MNTLLSNLSGGSFFIYLLLEPVFVVASNRVFVGDQREHHHYYNDCFFFLDLIWFRLLESLFPVYENVGQLLCDQWKELDRRQQCVMFFMFQELYSRGMLLFLPIWNLDC